MRGRSASPAFRSTAPTAAGPSLPIDYRAHGKDERLPVQSLYDNVVHWQLMLRDLAGK